MEQSPSHLIFPKLLTVLSGADLDSSGEAETAKAVARRVAIREKRIEAL